MRTRLLLPLIMIILLCNPGYAKENQSTINKSMGIDLLDLISFFLIPESADYNVPGWDSGTQDKSPINWLTDGSKWDDKLNHYVRDGKVVVTISGKPIHRLEKKMAPVQWPIKLLGSHAGIDSVEISSQINSQELTLDFEAEMKKRHITYSVYKCDSTDGASSGEKVYSVKAKGKKPCWIYYSWSCGSGGCSADLKILTQKNSADNLPGLTTKCTE